MTDSKWSIYTMLNRVFGRREPSELAPPPTPATPGWTPLRRQSDLVIVGTGFAAAPLEHPLHLAARHRLHDIAMMERRLNHARWEAMTFSVYAMREEYAFEQHLLRHLDPVVVETQNRDGTHNWTRRIRTTHDMNGQPANDIVWPVHRTLAPIELIVNQLGDE